MRKIILTSIFTLLFTGCTTVSYNKNSNIVRHIDYPEINKIISANIGDHMLMKGVLVEEDVLVVQNFIEGTLYKIPPRKYFQLGEDSKQVFFSADGIIKSFLADPYQALSVEKNQNKEICVITVFGGKGCYQGEFKIDKQVSEKSNSFQQTLIYSGKIGNKINIGYREFSNSTARAAFNNDVEYDLSDSKIIGYKGASLEIIEANNSSIKYRVIKNFP